jgi:hypothetical protein
LAATVTDQVVGSVQNVINALNLVGGMTMKGPSSEFQNFTNSIRSAANAERARQNQNRVAHAQEIASMKEIADAKQEQVKKEVSANNQMIESNRQRKESFSQMLEVMYSTEQSVSAKRIEEAQKFFEQRASLEFETHEQRLEWMKGQLDRIQQLEGNDRRKRLDAERGLTRAMEAESKKMLNQRIALGQMSLQATGDLVASLQQIFQNAGKQSYELAVALKAIAMAEALVNSYLAYTKALASGPPPWNMIVAGIVLAAGLAKQIAIATTPIPRAETGLQNYVVPDMPGNRRDGSSVMAQAGETVSVTPRGMENESKTEINVMLDEDVLFSAITRGIRTGRIDISTRNVGRQVFAV